ncbi:MULTISPECIES: MFS transporter [Tenebrionibacter/Tenebrionicola group]|jgi:DHA3 family macrolide efflux protein-like MFS transporter|uniref:MFS transporter n=2 Tax=Tenebrionibacter/Tenebrionicola group TaxID=2969848 RepID=A0A8K0V110_9ENTR|nr:MULTISPECIES: MFS transporter [Tenebrionibacter/Tenebrionicola group]MBK4715434.1 MFS transporter [Tenebrionibacter intestinalis]MBV5096102.1 MFS transporter [Tenebrionicola larvae]
MNWLKIKNFRTLLSSLFISKSGDYAYEVIFVFIVLESTHNNYLLTGFVYFFRFIPFLFFGPVGGWMADNYRLKNNLLISEWLRLAVSLLLFITSLSGAVNITILIVASILTTIGRSIFQPSYQTAVPGTVDTDRLTAANGISQVAEETASVVGPLFCSLILLFSDKPWVFLFNSVTYAVSIMILATFSETKAAKETPFRIKNVYQETLYGIKQLYWNTRYLYVVILGSCVCILFTGSVIRFIIPATMVSHGQSEVFTSWIFLLMAAGTITGGLLYGRFVRSTSPEKVMQHWFIYGLLLLLMSFSVFYSLKLLLPFAFVLGVSGAFVDISLITAIQSCSPAENIGKTFGTFSTLANTAEALSGLISGLFAVGGLMIAFVGMSTLIALTGITSLAFLTRKAVKNNHRRPPESNEPDGSS